MCALVNVHTVLANVNKCSVSLLKELKATNRINKGSRGRQNSILVSEIFQHVVLNSTINNLNVTFLIFKEVYSTSRIHLGWVGLGQVGSGGSSRVGLGLVELG